MLIFDDRHATRTSQLTDTEWNSFSVDLQRVQKALEKSVSPDHINIAALGNQIAHLHWHIIPRYMNDERWGAPIWTTTEQEMSVTSLSTREFGELAKNIRATLANY